MQMGLLALKALISAAKAAPIVIGAGKMIHTGREVKRNFHEAFHPRKDVIVMKKSTFAALIVVFAAIAGALTAAYFYLRRREAELDEYEQLLFSEDFSHEVEVDPEYGLTLEEDEEAAE